MLKDDSSLESYGLKAGCTLHILGKHKQNTIENKGEIRGQDGKSFNYGKWSKISNTFPLLFLNKMLVFRAGIHTMLFRIANREDPCQTASSEAV